VRTLANDLARDRQVSLAELRSLVRAGKLWAQTPAQLTSVTAQRWWQSARAGR